MSRITHLAFAFAITCLLIVSAQAQTPSIEVTADTQQVQFAVQGKAQAVRVEVFAPSGEMVFDSGAVTDQAIQWNMRDEQGGRVADGVYLATISVKESSGKARKRIEQIVVNREQQMSAPQPAAPSATITGTGTGTATSGNIARFTSASTIGNSVMTQSVAKNIGINIAPTAVLHVNEAQPAAVANNGTAAATLLQTSGGKGGNTTIAGKTGGKGASISLLAGNGGNGVLNATNGSGGSITLQPGSVGTGGTGGVVGNVLIAPTIGNVGIGTSSPLVKLHVIGATTAASKNPIIGGENTSSGIGVIGHSKSGDGVRGESDTSGVGVRGKSSTGAGVHGESNTSGDGVHGTSSSGDGVHGDTVSGAGVFGSTSGSGLAGKFVGPVNITGTLTVGSCTGCSPPSDRNLKANFSTVNPRTILDRLARVPIQTWNYKSEPETVRHIGAMAQDFRSAFHLGTDDHTLNTVDAQGVTMAAIQGLYQIVQEKDRQIERLTSQVTEQQARLNQVEHRLRKRQTRRPHGR